MAGGGPAFPAQTAQSVRKGAVTLDGVTMTTCTSLSLERRRRGDGDARPEVGSANQFER